MKIEDCEVGMKVRNCWHGDITKGDEEGIISNIEDDYINFEDRGDVEFYPEYFEPIDGPTNKFEVGDEVIYNCPNGIKYESIIFGIKDRQYAIKYTHKTIEHYDVVKERQLSPLKKKDELEVGDKFVNKISNSKLEVLATAYDDKCEIKRYFCKREDGLIGIWAERDVKDIIYD